MNGSNPAIKVLLLLLTHLAQINSRNFPYRLTQADNIQRQELLQRRCDKYDSDNKNISIHTMSELDLEHLLIDKKHKFLYCYVPKVNNEIDMEFRELSTIRIHLPYRSAAVEWVNRVACTNWKRVLMIMMDKTNETDPLKIPASLAHSVGMFDKLSQLSSEEKEQVLSDYTKFIIVRHPFERLLSAYRNKFEGNLESARYFQTRIGRLIIKNFRPHATRDSLLNGHDVTFDEFIRYLLTPELSMNYQSNQSSFNEHWESIAKLCHPCLIRYNAIGKYETINDDSALALHMIGADNVTFPKVTRTSGTSEKLQQYLDQLPLGLIRNLYKLYEQDFKLFDYNLDDILGFELG